MSRMGIGSGVSRAAWAVAAAIAVTFAVTAQAAPGEGIKAGDLVLSPYVEGQVIWDSNVRTTPDNEEDDVSVTGSIGLDADYDTEGVSASANVWGLAERYSDLTDEDHEDFGDQIQATLGKRELVALALGQSYQNIQDLDYAIGSIQERSVSRLSAGLGKNLTDKLEGDLGYAFSDTEYESPRLFDWTEQSGSLELAQAVTEKTSVRVLGVVGTQESDANVQDADFYTAQVGLKTRQTDKLVGQAGIGYHQHMISGDDIEGFSFAVGGIWQASKTVRVQLDAGNSVEPGTVNENNYAVVTRGAAIVSCRVKPTVEVRATGLYRNDDYDRPVMENGVPEDKETDLLSGALRLSYLPPSRALEAYVEGRVDERDSTIAANDYDQTVALVGLKLRY